MKRPRELRRLEDALVERRVSPDLLSWAAVWVSVAAGVALAAGGLMREPLLWLIVPPLVFLRLALSGLTSRVRLSDLPKVPRASRHLSSHR
jgi:hypothetical protein